MTKLLKHVVSKPWALAITIGVPLSVVIWHRVVISEGRIRAGSTVAVKTNEVEGDRRQATDATGPGLTKIADEAGTIGKFLGAPFPNKAGTKILFEESTKTGMGVFFCEIPGGHRQLLYVQPEKDYHVHDIRFFGWSPDDEFFAYCRRTNKREIVIGSADSAQTITTIPISQTIYWGAWMSPQTLVYFDSHGALHEIRQVAGIWHRPVRFKGFRPESGTGANETNDTDSGQASIQRMQVFNDSVIWQQDGTLWQCAYDSVSPVKIFESSTNRLLEFSVSAVWPLILLHCESAEGEFLTKFLPAKGDLPAQFSEIARIDPKYPATNVVWFNGIQGYSYLTKDGSGNHAFLIKANSDSAPRLQACGTVKSLSANATQLYVIGTRNLSDDLVGILRYGTNSPEFDCVVPNSEAPPERTAQASALIRSITNALGEKIIYGLRSPAGSLVKKKYPVVIGEGWIGYQFAVNDCGDYYADVPREHRSYEQWKEDVMAVYQDTIKNPDIDTNRVYVLGISEGASAAADLLESNPTLWYGAILFSPINLPRVDNLRVRKLLIDSGGADRFLAKDGPEKLSNLKITRCKPALK